VDISEQFHNFIMHASMQAYAGVDRTAYFLDEFLVQAPGKKGKRTLWVRWTRCGMGFKTSPYIAGQAMLFAEEVIRSSPSDHDNCFHFDEVRLNIPGQPSYNPQLPWVSKFRTSTGYMANDFYVYVDDVCTAGTLMNLVGKLHARWLVNITIWVYRMHLENVGRLPLKQDLGQVQPSTLVTTLSR
jgi:hypothetical protein